MTAPARIHPAKTQPAIYQKLAAFSTEVGQVGRDAGIDPRMSELIQMRASQINGCAYCIRVHTKRALAVGETVERLMMLPAWRESGLYSPRERAALALAEAVTLIHDGNLPDDVYDEATSVFTPSEYTAVLWIAVAINAFNRVAVAGRYPVEPEDDGATQG